MTRDCHSEPVSQEWQPEAHEDLLLREVDVGYFNNGRAPGDLEQFGDLATLVFSTTFVQDTNHSGGTR
jgi:hypothetical protein